MDVEEDVVVISQEFVEGDVRPDVKAVDELFAQGRFESRPACVSAGASRRVGANGAEEQQLGRLALPLCGPRRVGDESRWDEPHLRNARLRAVAQVQVVNTVVPEFVHHRAINDAANASDHALLAVTRVGRPGEAHSPVWAIRQRFGVVIDQSHAPSTQRAPRHLSIARHANPHEKVGRLHEFKLQARCSNVEPWPAA